MKSTGDVGLPADDVLVVLPNGDNFVTTRPYTVAESRGILVLIVISCISAIAVIGLLIAVAISAFNTRNSKSTQLFVRSHVAAYFLALLVCDLTQTVGSVMGILWVREQAVTYGSYCTIQGVVKHVADVGTAWWSTIIAMNTFWILFLRWRLRPYVLIGTMFGGWSAIAALISAGPAAIQTPSTGPFYGISGYWCWIADEYPADRITLDYMIMFFAAFLSFIMYTLVFLRLRGGIIVHRWYISFHRRPNFVENTTESADNHTFTIAKRMLLYPVAYTILLLPIAACRFAEWTGHEVPFAATIFSDSIFLLSGFVNVVLFITTRRVLPINSVIPTRVRQVFTRSSPITPSIAAAPTVSSAYVGGSDS